MDCTQSWLAGCGRHQGLEDLAVPTREEPPGGVLARAVCRENEGILCFRESG